MSKDIVVVGDVIIDEYTYGHALGISAETPTVVAELDSTKKFIGGAGLVTRHLLRLGANVTLIICTDEDELNREFRQSDDCPSDSELKRLNIVTLSHDLKSASSPWTISRKKRYIVDGYKLVQYDVLNKGRHGEFSAIFLNIIVQSCVDKDALVICDNRHGVMTGLEDSIVFRVDLPVYVDSQVSQQNSNIYKYYGADYALLNERELNAIVPPGLMGLKQRLQSASADLSGKIILKRGAQGAAMLDDDDRLIKVSGIPVTGLIDTCGAGDAFLASFVMNNNIVAANKWAALSVTFPGTMIPR